MHELTLFVSVGSVSSFTNPSLPWCVGGSHVSGRAVVVKVEEGSVAAEDVSHRIIISYIVFVVITSYFECLLQGTCFVCILCV